MNPAEEHRNFRTKSETGNSEAVAILPHQDKPRLSPILTDDGPGLFHALLGLVLALVFLASTVVYYIATLTALISPIVVLICHPAMKPKSVGGTGPEGEA